MYTTLHQITWIVRFTWIARFPWIDREDFLSVDVHVGPKEVEQQIPRNQKTFRFDTDEKACQILVGYTEIVIFWGVFEQLQESAHISHCEVIGTSDRNQLKDHPCQDT